MNKDEHYTEPKPEKSLGNSYIADRDPWTYAADLLRDKASPDNHLLSRGEAARIHHYIARTIGMDEQELAQKLSDEYMRLNGIQKP